MPNRRNFLQSLSSIPFISGFVPARVGAASADRDYFKELGVRPFINAAGTYTVMTASLMLPEVVEAINYASKTFVPLNDLHDAVGRRIAGLIGVEAAMVTSGAAAALTVGTAACMTGKNPDWIKRIPDLSGTDMKSEVIIQKSHRYGYDHAVRNCGIRMIEVESREELEQAVNPKTAMMLFFNDADPKGRIKIDEFVALGKQHGIPTFNDAAADVPPTENLSKYNKMGFDLVTFSGGKGLRGPQSAGLLLGRSDLIEAARLNGSPNSDSIGRGMKVNKEEMLGMMVAVEMYLKRDAEAEWKEWERRARLIADAATSNKSVQAEIYVPEIANHVPHIRISWNRTELNLTADEIKKRLHDGNPSIEIVPGSSPAREEKQHVSVGVWQMQPGEAEIVARRLRESLKTEP
ncbi:MAG: selenocysteine synthase [Acidobacteriota bacterium]|nr:MAG: selenocysteine synthase [Acidobacteriota bacterium]